MPEDKKIIIDEDWKSQVQAEKEAAAKSKPAPADAKSEAGDAEDMPMPPASFALLLSTLATEALVALGQLPHPATGEAKVHTHQAKYIIDTLDVLRQKTQGNLTADEQQMLDSLLHQLRLAFIEITNRPSVTAEASTTPDS